MQRDERGRFSGVGQRTTSSAVVVDALERAVADVAIELCLEIESNVREATPIDTGHAAASWASSIGDPITADVDNALAGARAAAGQAEVLGYQIGMGNLHVANPAEYIEILNGGSSDQAPAGFIEREAETALQTVQARHSAKETLL